AEADGLAERRGPGRRTRRGSPGRTARKGTPAVAQAVGRCCCVAEAVGGKTEMTARPSWTVRHFGRDQAKNASTTHDRPASTPIRRRFSAGSMFGSCALRSRLLPHVTQIHQGAAVVALDTASPFRRAISQSVGARERVPSLLRSGDRAVGPSWTAN